MTEQTPNSTGSQEPPVTEPPKVTLKSRVLHRLRNYMIAGLLVTAPIGLTVYMAWLFISWIDNKVMPMIPALYHSETYLPFSIPGVGLFIVLIGLILIGALTASLLGRTFLRLSERIMHRMPIVRGLYGTLKQVFETILSHQSDAFRQVVLVEYPRRGIWTIGFLTGETLGEVQNITKDRVLNIFIPTTPNPTSGFLLFIPEEDVIELSMGVEEGIKMVMSGGIVTPMDRRSESDRKKPKV